MLTPLGVSLRVLHEPVTFVSIRPFFVVISCNICNFCSLNPGHIPWVMTLLVMAPIPSFEEYFAKRGVDYEVAEGGGGSIFTFCLLNHAKSTDTFLSVCKEI